MKKIIILLLLCTISNKMLSQEESKSIKLHSIDLGFGGFSNKNYGGIDFYSNVALKSKANLFSISFITGGELNILGGLSANYKEYDLMYGKEFKIAKWISFEGFGGIGYFNQNSNKILIPDENAISFPVKINTKFYISKHFGLGINTNYSINKINNNFSANFIIHYKFK